jgi:putative acetyltransferase
VIVRPHRSEDYEAARYIYTEAFRRPENPESVPMEVPLFEALWEAGDALPEFSCTAQTESGAAVGHVTASKATVATYSVVAVGPIGVLPERQGMGIGSALMDALLTAADDAHVPLIVLLGSPQYYSRFGFRPAEQLGVTPPVAGWGDAFQARPLTAYTPLLAGPFQYAQAFSP